MSKNKETPYPAPKRGLPWELKYKFVRGQMTTLFKGFMYAIREECGAATALKLAEKIWKIDNRVKKMVHTFLNVFKIEGNDLETVGEFWNIYWEITGIEATILEDTKTYSRIKITECPWSTPDPKDISDWCIIWADTVNKSINPKITNERLKGMCAGDPYCEYVTKMEE